MEPAVEKVSIKKVASNALSNAVNKELNVEPEAAEDGEQAVVQKVCKPGQDEIFDNCVQAVQKPSEEDIDQEDLTNANYEANKNLSSKESGSAALDLVSNVAKKLNLEDDATETQEEKVIEFIEKKAEKQLEKSGKKVS